MFERDNCVISEILQSDWTIPNRAGVPRKSTKVPRLSFRVWAGRSGHETIENQCFKKNRCASNRVGVLQIESVCFKKSLCASNRIGVPGLLTRTFFPPPPPSADSALSSLLHLLHLPLLTRHFLPSSTPDC